MILLALAVVMQQAPSLIHFDWSLNVGNVIIIVVIVGIARKYGMPMYRIFIAWDASLKFLMEQYAREHDMSYEEAQALAIARHGRMPYQRRKSQRSGA